MAVRDTAAMEEGVKNCKCFIAIVTDNAQDSYFSREFARMEIAWAEEAGRKIVPVCAANDKSRIFELIAGGKRHGVDFS